MTPQKCSGQYVFSSVVKLHLGKMHLYKILMMLAHSCPGIPKPSFPHLLQTNISICFLGVSRGLGIIYIHLLKILASLPLT
jgi:hypothetical protein